MIKFHFGEKAIFSFLFLSISSSFMMAQTEYQEDTLQNSVIHLDEVQVISTRAGEKSPIAHTQVSKEQIESLNSGKDLPFLLSTTPSVTITSDAGNGVGYTTVRVRGVDPSRVNVTANGIPMNDAESSQVFWVNLPDFASSAESIQIQRGAGTSTNGAGAFGCLVLVYCKFFLARVLPAYSLTSTFCAPFLAHGEPVSTSTIVFPS